MKRRAFTLIEIMVAVVIMVILGGLMLYALKSTGTSAKTQATRVRLENLKSMLAEYELKTRFAKPASWPVTDGNLWFSIDTANPDKALPSPGNVRPDLQSDWMNRPATVVTVFVVPELKKIPSNAAAMGKLPASEFIAGTVLMADGWGNPLIFVPGNAGLGGEPFDSVRTYTEGSRVTNGGSLYQCIKQCTGFAPPNVTYWVGAKPIVAPNNRPFWASAGPDGDFTKADDNLYSFEQ